MVTSQEEVRVVDQPAKAFGHLKKELNFDFCLGCGACVASCPLESLRLGEGGPSLKGKCVSCGLCYYQCPQFVSSDKVAKRIFGEESESEDIGVYEKIYSARANDAEILERGQDGAAITALLVSLLEEDFIDGAVVTASGSDPWCPETRVTVSRAEIIEGAGTIYTRGPIILGVKDAVDLYGLSKMALVGTPCQIKAPRRMELEGRAQRRLGSKVKLLIGLFCTEAFSYPSIKEITEKKLGVNLKDVRKMDIDKGKFIVYSKEGSNPELSVSSLKQYATTPCKVCCDFSAELADVSVGSVGSPSGYSTVISRTPVGVEAFELAQGTGVFEAKPIQEVKPGIGLVRKLSLRKKKEARAEIEERRKDGKSLPPNTG